MPFLEEGGFGLGRVNNQHVRIATSTKVQRSTGPNRDHVDLVPGGVGEGRQQHVKKA